jgi:prepilin-type N-terminal cleavage/methylation domain-containing protein
MTFRREQTGERGFTLAEVVVSIAVMAFVMAGIIMGYVQTNYRAEWTSMSLVANSLAVASVEQARAAKWNIYSTSSGSNDEMPPGTYTNTFTNAVLVPSTGQALTVQSIVQVTLVTNYPPIRQIRADCWWQFPLTGDWFTNTVITLRGGS